MKMAPDQLFQNELIIVLYILQNLAGIASNPVNQVITFNYIELDCAPGLPWESSQAIWLALI